MHQGYIQFFFFGVCSTFIIIIIIIFTVSWKKNATEWKAIHQRKCRDRRERTDALLDNFKFLVSVSVFLFASLLSFR
jgi:hypothetical protein